MDDLEKQLRDKVREVDAAQKALDALRDEEQALREAIDNRVTDAFWQQNEGLRLEVGDKLLVTKEWLRNCTENKNPTLMSCVGDELVIVALKIPSVNFVVVERANSTLGDTWVNFDIARRMREAYLQAHGEAAGG